MKAELVENLILAHCNGVEQDFSDAVIKLASDEEKKGNSATAARLRRAYDTKKAQKNSNDFSASPSSVFASASTTVSSAPRDKDSLLELYEIVRSDVSLSDVVLPESQKEIIEQVIKEQNNAVNLLKHNVPPINRILLCGPPGCGKTMTANAIGHELNLPIAYVRLDGLVSSYLGQTSTNLRKVFDSVRDQRIILFLDEFDAIAKKRDDSNELGELKRVVTTLLQNFDNMPTNVLLIAATNHEHLLDPAIWRRFNVTITLERPNIEQRRELIQKEIDKYEIKGKVNVSTLAKVTEGVSAAFIAELMTSSAKKYLVDGKIDTQDIVNMLIRQETKYADGGENTLKVISEMMERGVSLRNAAAAIGVPVSTLEYQLKKFRGDE